MKRFNQYINGQREFKKTIDTIKLKDEKVIKKELQDTQYENFIKNLEKERTELKDLIFQSIFNKGNFIDEEMNEEQKEEIK